MSGANHRRGNGLASRAAHRRMAVAATACLLAPLAPAQQDAGVPLPEPPAARYAVELIVFAYEDAASAGNEVFAPALRPGDGPPPAAASQSDAEGPVFGDRSPAAADRPPATVGNATLEEIPARARIEFERVEPERSGMDETWRKLRKLDVYRPILHAAWTQTTQEKALSPALPLRSLSDPPLGLKGTVRLYQSRFLHLDVDLSLDAGSADLRRSATDRLVEGGESPVDGMPDAGLFRAPVHYRISEDRIMHEGEIRYFDHPRFGMLARVTRIEADGSGAAPP